MKRIRYVSKSKLHYKTNNRKGKNKKGKKNSNFKRQVCPCLIYSVYLSQGPTGEPRKKNNLHYTQNKIVTKKTLHKKKKGSSFLYASPFLNRRSPCLGRTRRRSCLIVETRIRVLLITPPRLKLPKVCSYDLSNDGSFLEAKLMCGGLN